MRSAREDRNGIVRTCPVSIPDLTLNPGQTLTFRGQMLAPDERKYYLLFLGFIDYERHRGDPVDITLAADM